MGEIEKKGQALGRLKQVSQISGVFIVVVFVAALFFILKYTFKISSNIFVNILFGLSIIFILGYFMILHLLRNKVIQKLSKKEYEEWMKCRKYLGAGRLIVMFVGGLFIYFLYGNWPIFIGILFVLWGILDAIFIYLHSSFVLYYDIWFEVLFITRKYYKLLYFRSAIFIILGAIIIYLFI